MGNAGGQELVGWFHLTSTEPQNVASEKKFHVFEIRGHVFAREKSIMICY